MKTLPWILVVLLAIVAVAGWLRPRKTLTAEVERDTLIIRDTVRDSVPKPVLVRFDCWDTLRIPVHIIDTLRDSFYIPVPIERKEYRTEDYRAVVSGYRPRLESMDVFRRTQAITVTAKPKRWGLGPQAGFGIPGGWYVGIGISYDLWQW